MNFNIYHYTSRPEHSYSHMVSTKSLQYYDEVFKTSNNILSNINGNILFSDKYAEEFNFIINTEHLSVIKLNLIVILIGLILKKS